MRRAALVMVLTALVVGGTATPALANQEPVTEEDSYSMAAGTILEVPAPGVLGNDVDPDGDPLTVFMDIQYDSNVDLREDGSFTFTPPPGFTGDLYSFDYYAFDGEFTPYGHVYIRIYAEAVANDDDYAALNTVQRRVSTPGVLANDIGVSVRLETTAAHGIVRLQRNGGFVYRAQPGFVGIDSFTYRTWSGAGQDLSPPATVTIRVKASNVAPVAAADTFLASEDIPLFEPAPGMLANDTDPDGDPMIPELITYPYGDGFELFPDGSFEYYPPADYDSPVTFQYRVFDGLAYSPTITSTIDIRFVNDSPTAYEDDFYLTAPRSAVPAPGVLGNDEGDVEGDPYVAVLDSQPAFGRVRLNPDGSFGYDQVGPLQRFDSFTYHLEDSHGAISNSATVSLSG